jgi:hypothetical protein
VPIAADTGASATKQKAKQIEVAAQTFATSRRLQPTRFHRGASRARVGTLQHNRTYETRH